MFLIMHLSSAFPVRISDFGCLKDLMILILRSLKQILFSFYSESDHYKAVVPFRSSRREYAPLLFFVISRPLFSMKGTDACSSYGISKRGTAPPLYTDAQAQLDMLPSHFSIISTPPLNAQGTNRVLSFVRLYSERDKAIFSVLGSARVQPDPCGRRQQKRP